MCHVLPSAFWFWMTLQNRESVLFSSLSDISAEPTLCQEGSRETKRAPRGPSRVTNSSCLAGFSTKSPASQDVLGEPGRERLVQVSRHFLFLQADLRSQVGHSAPWWVTVCPGWVTVRPVGGNEPKQQDTRLMASLARRVGKRGGEATRFVLRVFKMFTVSRGLSLSECSFM